MDKDHKYRATDFALNCEVGRSFSLSSTFVRNRSPPESFDSQM